jgi:NTE family protein
VKKPEPEPATKGVNLALQGGGAHGAFTWGVVDRLLEDGRLSFDAISGTSAGAMNGAALVSGMVKGGPEGARETLHRFWRAVARLARLSPIQGTPLDQLLYGSNLDMSPAYAWWDVATRFFSPYDLNPLDWSPMREIVERLIDFDAIRTHCSQRLFVSATNVHTGKMRVFSDKDITADAVMASACLPFMFQAVEIDGVPYWDGGYMGNPPLFPFYRTTDTEDVLIVQINPIERKETPRSAREIMNRMNEITFNSALIAEFRAIDFVNRLIDDGKLKHGGPDGYKKIRLHRVAADEALKDLSASSKFNADWSFLTALRDHGREAASQWLDTHYAAVGKTGTMDVKKHTKATGAVEAE